MAEKIHKSDDEWRAQLTPEQYRIARQGGTEPAFSGEHYDRKEKGIYRCVCCGTPLFSSAQKYDSGSGWPSFWEPISGTGLETTSDSSFGMRRTEVTCASCQAHLGHVFNDGPPPSGLRYCINSAALDFDAGGVLKNLGKTGHKNCAQPSEQKNIVAPLEFSGKHPI